MAAVLIRPPRDTPTPPPMPSTTTSAQPLSVPGVSSTTPISIPNKHMPAVGPNYSNPVTPPASPRSENSEEANGCMSSLLYPADDYPSVNSSPPVRAIDAAGVAASMNFTSRQPLPNINDIFPWAHGLHQDNSIQLAFFFARKRAMRRAPTCYRGVVVVKVGDQTHSRLKGSIAPEEILHPSLTENAFLNIDPKEGFSVRNFHIQVAKFACLSDIIVYGEEDEAGQAEVLKIAKRISAAQLYYRAQFQGSSNREFPIYSTFIIKSPFSMFEKFFPEIVTTDSNGRLTGQVIDFCHWERVEMCTMSKATEFSKNVWLGPTADAGVPSGDDTPRYNLLIEASDQAAMPSVETLGDLHQVMESTETTQVLVFPGSGTMQYAPRYSTVEIDGIIDTCRLIHSLANGSQADEDHDDDGDHLMTTPREPRKILIHCTDGYTETSLLALAYLMYAEGLPAHAAWVTMHTTKGRNFFAYDRDLQFLRHIESRILEAAAETNGYCLNYTALTPPEWIHRLDGSLPSRVLPYMYLGNLQHANNPQMLAALGIKRVLSIGEELSWTDKERHTFNKEKAMVVRDLQDNGCDPLESQFRNYEGRRANEPILVHCRVGVSRSATICIAEVMRALKLSLPRAYCYVRARRLNVIIQPHLRFMYELLKFEETMPFKNRHGSKRELEWHHIAREVATMNRPYTRQN
ncbi:uncharacterized protein H6S33_004699 [Morchella sextelata]|uniref:uncharacterized protein n=1 Tax=Morchella sextelata TaxID=1174677 RepID=UPI001D04A722|nr:uncharacterized protein H6S33_004699 [Morchella sextelata]KAH0605477.1 hypothetical protein H6S33_004699 [Morchella sextelata]